MATRVPPSSEIFPGEPNQYSGLKANQAEHRSKMKHDRVELLFLHTPSPVDQQASFKVTFLECTSSRTRIRLSQIAVCDTAAHA